MAEALKIQPITVDTLRQLFIINPINDIDENKIPGEQYDFCHNCDPNFNYFFDLTENNEIINNFRRNIGMLHIFFHNLQRKLSINASEI
jgi:hypothetical protein